MVYGGQDRDASPPLNIAFTIQLLGANGKCINEDPSMSAYYVGDPFGSRPGGTFYYDPSRHLPYGPPGSGNAFSHTPGPFQVYFRLDPKMCTPAAIAEARQRNSTGNTGVCSIGIDIKDFHIPSELGFDLRVNYLYAPGRAARGPSVPLKLFWSAQRGDNFTTATAQGESDALAAGYVFVRVDGYVFPTQ